MASFAQDLHTLTRMSLKTLAARIEDEDRAAEAADLVVKQQSRNLLRLYFEDRGLLDQDIEDGLDTLRLVYSIRHVTADGTLLPCEEPHEKTFWHHQFLDGWPWHWLGHREAGKWLLP